VCIHLAAEHALELQAAHIRLECPDVALDRTGSRFVVFQLGEFEQLRGIAQCVADAVELLQLSGQARTLAPQLLGPRGVAPDRRVFEFAADFL
jgi:hypothetical protein